MKLRRVNVTIDHSYLDFETLKRIEKEPEVFSGFFHRWEDYSNGNHSHIYAIVELENGHIKKFAPEQIRFTDNPIFDETTG